MTARTLESKMSKGGYLGIDVGLSGWYAEVGQINGDFIMAQQVPVHDRKYDIGEFWKLVRCLGQAAPVFCVLEEQQVFPRQGAVAGFTLGLGVGLWKMALTAADIRYQEARPQVWRKAMGLAAIATRKKKRGESDQTTNKRLSDAKRKRKQAAYALAQSLYPGAVLTRPGRKIKGGGQEMVPNYDLADALLLATYARRLHCGGLV